MACADWSMTITPIPMPRPSANVFLISVNNERPLPDCFSSEALFSISRDKTLCASSMAMTNRGVLNISNMTPGDGICFKVNVKNNGNVNVMYKVNWKNARKSTATGKDMFEVLNIAVYVKNENGAYVLVQDEISDEAKYYTLGAPTSETTFMVVVEFPNGTPDHDNMYQGAGAEIQFVVETVQQNGVDGNGDLILPTNP